LAIGWGWLIDWLVGWLDWWVGWLCSPRLHLFTVFKNTGILWNIVTI